MKIFLWLLTALLTSIPLLMYLAYSMRRLDTRRQLLLKNLFTLFLDDDYMRIQHGRSYHAWKEIRSSEERKKKVELDYFNKDFKAQNGHQDFFPPVALTTVLSGAGWYFVLSHVYPAAGSPQLTQLVPETLAWGFAGGLAPGGGNEFSKLFEEVNAVRLIKDVAKGLGQSEDELKAFMYNMYYDPVLIFIYEVWGRYGQPSPI